MATRRRREGTLLYATMAESLTRALRRCELPVRWIALASQAGSPLTLSPYHTHYTQIISVLGKARGPAALRGSCQDPDAPSCTLKPKPPINGTCVWGRPGDQLPCVGHARTLSTLMHTKTQTPD